MKAGAFGIERLGLISIVDARPRYVRFVGPDGDSSSER
jgi:hypothetical protein